MSLPTVAIVGRPNVGKSSLLNALSGRRIAIVDPTPGVTRDRISVPCAVGDDESDGYVQLVDTGGMGIEDSDNLTEHVETQIRYAVAEADVILFIVDAREGVTPLEQHVAKELRRVDRPIVLIANKIDEADLVSEIGEFCRLGFGEPIGVSAKHTRGFGELRDAIREHLGERSGPVEPEPVKLAIVGKRNAGKSTFINALSGGDRVIVSETPGTTRDSVDVRIEIDDEPLLLIDTAGVRKKRKLTNDIEFYSQHRALRSVRRADVVAMVIDASTPISQVDKALGGDIAEEFKPVVLVVNKWDLAREHADADDYAEYLTKALPGLSFAPISLTSAMEKVNITETVRLARQLHQQTETRVSTAQLNQVIEEIVQLRGPSHKTGTKPPKILYASQISTSPPTIVCFVNDVRSFSENYQRFLVNQFRDRLPFAEVPIRLILRQRRGGKRKK